MSLLKKRHMSAARLAALEKNRQHAHGPVTAAGRERIRAANLQHGFYSQVEEEPLLALGEDPKKYHELLEGLRSDQTAAILHDRLAERLARALWRMQRADHIQDGRALNTARAEERSREARLHMQMMRLKMTSRNWQKLAQAVACPHYVTTPADLDMMRQLHKEEGAKEMSEVALALFYQLREPGLLKPGDEGFEDEEQAAKRRQVMNKIRGIFGLKPLPLPRRGQNSGPDVEPDDEPGDEVRPSLEASEDQPSDRHLENDAAPSAPDPANPDPNITEAEWQAREPVRQLLENLLTRQVEIFDAQHRDLMRQVLAGPSIYERAAEIAPNHPDALFMQRIEDSNCRQVMRMASLLMRLRRQEFKTRIPKSRVVYRSSRKEGRLDVFGPFSEPSARIEKKRVKSRSRVQKKGGPQK